MVNAEVVVSCAAIIKKIMWSMTSASLKRWPSSSVAWQSWLNRSGPTCPSFRARFSANLFCMISTRTRRPRTPRHMASPGTGLRTKANEAATVSTKARFMRSASVPVSVPKSNPMKTRAAMFSVNALS